MRNSSSSYCSPERTHACLQTSHSKFSFSQLEVLMKKIFFRSLMMFAVALIASLPVLADTVRLKDGSVIRGQIVSFKNEQFTIVVGSGSRGGHSTMQTEMADTQ